MLTTSKLHFSLNFYLLLLHANKLAERHFRRKIFFQLLWHFSFFFQPSTWVSENRIDPMLFLSNSCLDALYTIHQLLSLGRKAGKTKRKPEIQTGYGRQWNGCTELEARKNHGSCLSDALCALSWGVTPVPQAPGVQPWHQRDEVPVVAEAASHTVLEVSAGLSHLSVFLLLPCTLSVTALQT